MLNYPVAIIKVVCINSRELPITSQPINPRHRDDVQETQHECGFGYFKM